MLNECPFCSQMNLALRKFYENKLFLAIYNLRPVVPGHSLVFPKRHVRSIMELNDEEKAGLVSFIDRTTFIALKYADRVAFDLILQEGESAGQSIPHMHLHVIPRTVDDDLSKGDEWVRNFKRLETGRKPLTNTETTDIVGKLRDLAGRLSNELEVL